MRGRRCARSGRGRRPEPGASAAQAAAFGVGLLLAACRASPAQPELAGAGPAAGVTPAATAPALPPGVTASPPQPPPAPLERQLFNFERRCMGTRCTIAALHTDRNRVEQAVNRAVAEIDRLDAM